jgi:hypothetical protein
MDQNVKLAYLVYTKTSPAYCSDVYMDIYDLMVKHRWLGKDEMFIPFALRTLLGRLMR